MNYQAARLACEARDAYVAKHQPPSPRVIGGALGPTNRTASLSPDVNDASYRNGTCDALSAAYYEAAKGLLEGGADLLIVETIFDTLNAKAAIFAIQTLFEERGEKVPLLISGTIVDMSGRNLSGQTVEAIYQSIRHANPLIVGLNCSLGAEMFREYIERLSNIADTYVSIYPNAGLPNEFGEFDQERQHWQHHRRWQRQLACEEAVRVPDGPDQPGGGPRGEVPLPVREPQVREHQAGRHGHDEARTELGEQVGGHGSDAPHGRREGRGIVDRRAYSASRWTVSGEKAGRQMATYSAPPSSGLL
jgi:hypothetical protein